MVAVTYIFLIYFFLPDYPFVYQPDKQYILFLIVMKQLFANLQSELIVQDKYMKLFLPKQLLH